MVTVPERWSNAVRRRQRRDEDVRISIVVPARDAAGTIGRTLDSVAVQTSDRWDLIVVDDGSVDDTAAVVGAWAGDRDDVSIVTGPGEGVSGARNRGTDLAGPWVLYLDADDWIGDRYIELMVAALERDASLDGVRCVWAYETPDGRTQAWDDLDLSDLFGSSATRCPFALHACVARTDLVREIGGFDRDLVIGEDWDLWQRFGRAGGQLGFVNEVLAYYTMRADSAMHIDFDRMQRDLLTVFARGHSPDPRVPNPLPHLHDGAARQDTFDVQAETLAGTMGVAVPTEVDLAALIPNDPPDPHKTVTPDDVAGALHESVAFGSCSLLADWPELYVRFEDRIHEMLDLYSAWLDRPGFAYQTLRILEFAIATSSEIESGSTLGGSAVVEMDLRADVGDVSTGPDVDQLVVRARYGSRPVGFARVPVVDGGADRRDIVDAVVSQLGPRLVSRSSRHGGLAARVIATLGSPGVIGSGARALLDTPWRTGRGRRDTVDRVLRWGARESARRLLGDHQWTAEAVRAAAASPPAGDQTTDADARDASDALTDDAYGVEYFDGIFSDEDPWIYGGKYEQTKYEQTLELLGDRRFGRALELACAEGHFTVQLAPRVDHLVAADISPTALERAAERCREFTNIEFRHVDLRDEEYPGELDLIVCSEVLYFLEEEGPLAEDARPMADSLVPGGLILMAHANLVVDDPDRSGFDWGHGFGARRLGEVFEATPGLRLHTIATSELYRIHLFERVEPGAVVDAPVEIEVQYAEDLDPHIERMVMWDGIHVIRETTYDTEVSDRIPLLAYHRISPDGNPELDDYRTTPDDFAEHLEHLRKLGYYGISMDEWREAMYAKRPPVGRAVMITFDDGYQDFHDYAYPVLYDLDFPATVFVVTDLVGTTSSWDARFGEQAPLMGWDEMRRLAARGVNFASHTATHLQLPTLSPAEMLAQETRAREALRRELGVDAYALAYPFGLSDPLTRTTMRRAGYEMAFTTTGMMATVWDDPMAIHRVEIYGSDTLDEITRKLGGPSPVNPIRKGLRGSRSVRSQVEVGLRSRVAGSSTGP